MKLKNKTKFLLVLGIIFVAFLLFNTNTVNAAEISDYKCKIEKDDYILYNNYFNTEDVTFYENVIKKEGVDKVTFNNMIKDNVLFLIEVPNDADNVEVTEDQEKLLEIIELNNKKYAVVQKNFDKLSDVDLSLTTPILEITRNGETEKKYVNIYDFRIYNTDDFICETRVVSETGLIYGVGNNVNHDVNGMGLISLPGKLDLSKCYVEYLTNTYVGETLKVDCLGNVPYVGKYGNQYKYKMSLKNVKVGENDILPILQFSYKGSYGVGDFYLDEDYTINNETYIEQTKTNTSTKLKFDLKGKFKGTLKAEQIEKGDLIYNKVNQELKKYGCDLFMDIINIYIENGSYEGPLKLTFYVGEQYNGKTYNIVHMKDYNYNFENFEGIVENGKIEIVVNSLSPFGIAITETEQEDNTQTNQETTTPTTDKGEKDNTPKTGTTDIICYVLATTVLAGVGIVALKKNLE